MPPVDRKNPVRAKSSESSFSVMEFIRVFPDDDACLNWLWRTRHSDDGEHAHCPRCDKQRRFRHYANKTRTRQVWTCTSCTHQISPTAGTIFHKSSTSLHLWFYAMWIMTSTRCGVSAKQLERELGVTYKTAWRMFNKIRNELMTQDYQGPLDGEVEVDETFIGGKPRNADRRRYQTYGWSPRQGAYEKQQAVFGAVTRKGQVVARVIPNSSGPELRRAVRTYVVPEAMLYTDEWKGYNTLDSDYQHRRIRHRDRIYVDGDVHTQTIEGFWSLVKRGMGGTYHCVSRKWLQGYLNEYAWRYNHRDDGRAMFLTLLLRAAQA